jgi:GH15 family glucan-1,4-alpha-glucosidase
MDKGYNHKLECFIQSYESNEILDSAVLIAPLVFFISPTDPRFVKTLDKILKAPEKGGLTSTGLVYRYNHALSDDGIRGKEGAFSMCRSCQHIYLHVRHLLTTCPTLRYLLAGRSPHEGKSSQ